jgi:hypothetical protein
VAKLNQILAIEKGIKSGVYSSISTLDKQFQKPELFVGFSRTYQSNADDGDKLPPESKKVQAIVADMLKQVVKETSTMLNVTARKDWTNCVAKAPVMVDGVELIEAAPVSYLLFLEKQLNDLHTMIGRMPIMDTGEDWVLDENTGLSKTPIVQTHRTKKTQRPIVLYEATDKHPAQTQLIQEDVVEGYWSAVKFSGAMQRPARMAMLERIEKLQQAVKQAREAANIADEVPTPDVGALLFAYIMPKKEG